MTESPTPTEAVLDRAHQMISSTRVEGTPVYNKVGEQLGVLHSVMIHKRSGQVTYALLSLASLPGCDAQVHPLPWATLDYDADRHGYVVDLTDEALSNAPMLHLDVADRPTEINEAELLQHYRYYTL